MLVLLMSTEQKIDLLPNGQYRANKETAKHYNEEFIMHLPEEIDPDQLIIDNNKTTIKKPWWKKFLFFNK